MKGIWSQYFCTSSYHLSEKFSSWSFQEPCCQHTYYRARWLLPTPKIDVSIYYQRAEYSFVHTEIHFTDKDQCNISFGYCIQRNILCSVHFLKWNKNTGTIYRFFLLKDTLTCRRFKKMTSGQVAARQCSDISGTFLKTQTTPKLLRWRMPYVSFIFLNIPTPRVFCAVIAGP